MLDNISLVLVIIGALNWGSIGLFGFDFVGAMFGGREALRQARLEHSMPYDGKYLPFSACRH